MATHLPQQGLDKSTLLEQLEGFRSDDMPWRDGKVFAYNYEPEEDASAIMKTAYMQFLGENALDFTTVPSVMRMEREVVRMIINLLQGEETVVGSLTSGGTESILLAIKTARDRMRAERPHITAPEMIIPETAHAAFHKAAAYFDVKAVTAPVDPVSFRTDTAAMARLVTPNTILLVGSAPGYAHGVMDPIEDIGALALKHDLMFHVDACVGGIHFAIMRRMGYGLPAFDWSVPGVTSISADLHKYGYAAKNVSCLMHRNKDIRRYQIFSCTRTTTYALVNPTILSTKSGGPVAGAWTILHYLGEDGYAKLIEPVMACTRQLIDGIQAIPELQVLGNPEMCMFSFASDSLNIFQIADEMKARGWYVQPQFSTEASPSNLHLTITRTTVPHVAAFLESLREAVEAVKAGDAIDAAMVKEQVRALVGTGTGPETVAALEAMAGLDSGGLPEGMALLNTVLDALPDALAEALLTSYVNDLFT